jgi:hypothetical protein
VNGALNTSQRQLDIFIANILDALMGILEHQISPSLLIVALMQSIPYCPKDTVTPFPLSKISTNLLYKVYVCMPEAILGYVSTLPLVNKGVFKIFNMIPIPVTSDSNRFVY